MSVSLGFTIIFLCVILEAFFSGSEIALVSVDKLRLKEDARKGKHAAKLILKLLENPEKILGTTLLGTNVATITGTTVSAAVFYKLLGAPGIPVSVIVITAINWIFSEIVPKSIFQQLSDEIIPKAIYGLVVFYILFYPVIFIFTSISKGITKLFGGMDSQTENSFVSKEELQQIMNMRYDHSDVKPGEKTMISRVLDFNEITVKEVMVPLINVTAVASRSTVGETAKIVQQSKHRRLPVYTKRIDKIIGIINTFDLLNVDPEKKISGFVRSTYFIPSSMKAADLLEELQKNRRNMAIVVDEYGGAEGIVTIEDILEEVVGEIEDEYDNIQQLLYNEKGDTIIAKAHMELDEFNARSKMKLPDGDYNTLGGFFLEKYGRIPKRGETLTYGNKKFIIQKVTDKSIVELKIVDA